MVNAKETTSCPVVGSIVTTKPKKYASRTMSINFPKILPMHRRSTATKKVLIQIGKFAAAMKSCTKARTGNVLCFGKDSYDITKELCCLNDKVEKITNGC